MMSRLVFTTLFVIGLMFPGMLTADPINIEYYLEGEKIGPFLEFLEDKDKNLTLNDIVLSAKDIESKWQQSGKKELGFGFSKSVYWIRFTVENKTDKTISWYLNQEYPLIDYLSLFMPNKDGNYSEIKTGDYFVFAQRPVKYRSFLFPLKTSPETTETYYLRYETSSSMNVTLTTWSSTAFEAYKKIDMMLYWTFYGALAIILLYNLFISWYSREWSYAFFVLFLACFLLSIMSINGAAFQYLWPASVWWANICIPIISSSFLFSIIQFSRVMMRIKTYWPLNDRFHQIIGYLFILNILITLFTNNYRFGIIVLVVLAAPTGALGSFTSAYMSFSSKYKNREALFFFIAHLFFFGTIILIILKTFSILPSNFLTTSIIHFTVAFGIVILSLFLPDRLNLVKKELKSLSESLEELVKKRTSKLNATQTKLLQTAHKAGMTDMSRDTVRFIGSKINSVKIPIEELRKMRALHSVKALKQANDLLRENITHLESFILDDPKGVVLMKDYLGIEKIIDLEQEKIGKSVDRLNSKIHEIVILIDAQRKYASDTYFSELLHIANIIDFILDIQKKNIERAGITVEKEFEDVPKTSIQKSKLSYIITNLISNAIQAMSAAESKEKKLTLSVNSNNGLIYVRAKDTGIGIAQDNLDKIFRHGYSHVTDKKGIGLHTCGNYMTEMGGKIWAESAGHQKGATFILEFPIGE